jgi:ABC-type dipeptide/oligopeptide/nickel transport system permease subunit
MTALVFLVLVVLVAIFAPLVAPKDPNEQDLFNRFKGWSGNHPLGTDGFGRDVLSRIIYGARTSLLASLQALGIAVVLGAPLGLLAGYIGGKVDIALNWVSDAMMSMPALIVAFTIIAVLGNNLTNAMVAVGIVVAPRFFRIARASTQDVKHETYVEAVRSLGCTPFRIVWRHIVPNMINPIVVQASLTFGTLILVEATLSFPGLGAQPPTSSWGAMIATAAQGIYTDKWAILAPGIVIVLTVLAFSITRDALGDAIAPGSRREQM